MITNEQIETAIRTFADDPAGNLELLAEAIDEIHMMVAKYREG